MTWDEVLEFDKCRKTVELSPEAQRWIESFAVEVGPSADTMPKVTYTTTGDSFDSLRARYEDLVHDLGYTARPDFLARYECTPAVDRVAITTSIKDPYEDIANCYDNVLYGADWIIKETDKIIDNLRKEDKTMANEIRRKDCPINLGRDKTDIDLHTSLSDAIFHPEYVIIPSYKRVIFNQPATIILWNDGTKTVVKCGPNDVYDPEKGLAMCLLKKLCGNDGIIFHRTIRKMMESYEPPVEETESHTDILRRVNEKLKEMSNKND